jgi:hypothetical protein
MFPSNGSMNRRPLPWPGSLRVRFPRLKYYEALRRPASLSPRFVSFAWQYHPVRLEFRSPRPRRETGGQELVIR